MKNKLFLAFVSLWPLPALLAAPLTETTAVQTRPDAAAPAITFLKAGTEPTAASHFSGTLPPGWMAVELPGPFEGYVANNDITKNLDVAPGAAIQLAPKVGSPVLTQMEKGDKAEITGLPQGKFLQVRIEKKINGFIRVAGATTGLPAATPSFVENGTPPAATTTPVTTAGKPVPVSNVGGTDSSAELPRLFQGKFVSTRRALAPKRPFDYQLNDEDGARIAYVDLSKLLLTDQIERYMDHVVVVYGTAKNEPDAKAIVIRAESLQLK